MCKKHLSPAYEGNQSVSFFSSIAGYLLPTVGGLWPTIVVLY